MGSSASLGSANSGVEHPDDAASFGYQFSACIHALREALRELVGAAGGDATKPQDLARQYQLDKSLAWKLSRLIQAENASISLRFLPGPSGLRILAQSLGEHAPEPPRAEFMRAVQSFEEMASRHAGDRPTLEMLAQGLDQSGGQGEIAEPQSLLRIRREAFRGNSALWGVQASAQFCMVAFAPNAEDRALVDCVEAQGITDFRRIRSDTNWHPFSRVSLGSDQGGARNAGAAPLDGGPADADTAPVLKAFCSEPTPNLRVVHNGRWTSYELPPGPVGNTNLETVTFGTWEQRAGSRVAKPPFGTAEIIMHCATPTEFVQIDVLVHTDLGWNSAFVPSLYGMMTGRGQFARPARSGRRLPLESKAEHLGKGLGQFRSEQLPRSVELADTLMRAAGWDSDNFEVYRLSMLHPPIPSALLLATDLPSA